MPNHAGVLQSLFFPAKLETEGDGSIFNTLLAELTVFYCEEVFDFLAGCGMDDEGFYDALVRMFEQALKYVLALPTAQQSAFLARLDRVRQLGQNVGWGVGDDFDHFWSEAGLEGDE
jgi:hypothetical protein